MSTTKQKDAARENLKKARQAQSQPPKGKKASSQTNELSTADRDRLKDRDFAFPAGRKEPLTDAEHVRNAIARFRQVEGVSDADRDRAWKRIEVAAKKFDVSISEKNRREL